MTRTSLARIITAAACLLVTSARAADWSAWHNVLEVRLDTTTAGADVKGDVANFPLAIALTTDNFDFTTAKPDGADLRASAGDAELPLSIEHWDAANKSALVWIKLPLVKGNNADQAVTLHWGNGDAASASDSGKVFDTKDGFVGVWHLDEEGSVTDGAFKDATANAADGTGVNLKPGSRVNARAGKGIALKHDEAQWVKVDSDKRKLFDLTEKFSFSIWVLANGFGNKGDETKRQLPGYETMFCKGDNSWRLQKFGVRDWHKPNADLIETCVERAPKGDECLVGKLDMKTGTWYHFTVVADHPTVRLYVNGVLNVQDKFDMPWKSDDHPVAIGNQSQIPTHGRSWDGILDEARVMSVPKDENWVKLDYESQREGQKLATFGPVQKH